LKIVLAGGQLLSDEHGGEIYARAQNRRPALRAAYDAVLESVDVLVLPTTPMKAESLGPPRDGLGLIAASSDIIINTAAFDVTGHPALSVPCGTSGGLPVGMMLVGRPFEDATVLRIASAYEQRRG
jgi:amidase